MPSARLASEGSASEDASADARSFTGCARTAVMAAVFTMSSTNGAWSEKTAPPVTYRQWLTQQSVASARLSQQAGGSDWHG